ncbi:hypothetical protein ACFX13_032966 [Malus domestica]|uniref:uncharacterized protein n=1 Tax=Malus domestica TaxID=3750 RepID=UPI0010AB4335|nr:uncharacterized protein LOC114824352 [Malus domestica]
MQAFNSNNDGDYEVFVTVENTVIPLDESPPTPLPLPRITILFNVVISYNVDSDITGPIRAYNARLRLDHPFHSFTSCPRDAVSNMIAAMQIPFPLDRLRWKTQSFGGSTEPLESVEAMISKIVNGVNAMVSDGKLGIIVTIEKEIKMVAHQVFDEMQMLEVQARELRDELESEILGNHQDNRALLAIYDDGLQLPQEGWARQLREEWGSAVSRLNHISVMLSADDMHGLEGAIETLLGLRDSVIRTCAKMRLVLALLRQNTRDSDDRLLTEAVVRESLDQAVFRPMPATKASVEALNKFVFDGSSCDQLCVVCLEKMLSGDQVTCLPCSHIFHGDCIIQWLNSGHTCPVCRFRFPTN